MAINVLTGAKPGQATAAEQEVIAGAPAAELQERVPQSEGLDALLSPVEAAPAAPAVDAETQGIIDEGIQAGITAEEGATVPTLTERGKGEVDSIRWSPDSGLKTAASADGGVAARAKNVSDKFATSSRVDGGVGFSPSATVDTAGITGAFSKMGALLGQQKVETAEGNVFQTDVDPMFLQVGSAVTENIITRLAQGKTAVADFQQEKIDADTGEVVPVSATGEVSKSQGNAEIGREAHREYQRIKNARLGLPTDQYVDLSNEDAAVVGDSLKEMYAAANPHLIKRVTPPGEAGQVSFQLTPEGDASLNSEAANYKRAQMFPGINVRPLKAPTKSGQVETEVGRTATKKSSGKVKGTPAGRELIEESTRNLNSVANVVDVQRMKILFSTILPHLRGDQDANPVWAEINNIGRSASEKFAAAQKAAEREGIEYSAADELAKLQYGIAQNVRAIAMERKGANYLTYYIQNFNGRTAPQQSFFDPTTSKAVRFVTRAAVPAKATKGNRQYRNLQQMYAMMLVKGADASLPQERVNQLTAATPKLLAWGKALQAALDATMTDAQAEQIAAAIEAGQPLGQMNFQQMQISDPDLLKAIDGKGEDGPAFIDGLIDFAKFHEATEAGRPYHSYFNAYMDGKTNGIASNGIQMGSKEVALKTGVMRTGNKSLLDEGDVRDFLMAELTDQLETSGLQSSQPELYTVARALYNYRQLAKDTTMTFGYGKELESFANDVSASLDLLIEKNPEVAAAMEMMIAAGGSRDSIVETLHKEYVNHLGGALSQEAMEARPLMRGVATYFALIDKPFTMTTATGFELNLAGEVTTGEHGANYQEQEYTIWENGKKRKVTSQVFGTRSTAAAEKGDQGVGSRAWGGSLPGPVQSLDAATIAMTTTGESWKKLSAASAGNPYIHHVYDAIKADANGFDVLLAETNKNWLNASMEWSYLQASLDSLNAAMAEFNDGLKHFPDSLPILAGPTDEFAMFGVLSKETESASGNTGPWELTKRLTRIREQPDNKSDQDWFFENLKLAKTMINELKQRGFKQESPTMGDFKFFMKMMNEAVGLGPRMRRMIEKTNKNKQELAAEMKRLAPSARESLGFDLSHGLQYYAH